MANSGVYLGPAIGAPIIVWLIASFGWRIPFYILGVVGILWVLVWVKIFTDQPKDNKYMSNEEKKYIEGEHALFGRKKVKEKQTLKELFTIPKGVRATIFSNWWIAFCFGYCLYFLMTWLPGYLTMQKGMSLSSMGIALMFPWIAAAIGISYGGKLSDAIFIKTNSKRKARAYWAAGAFLLVTISMYLVVQVESLVATIVILSVGAMANAAIGGVVGAVLNDTIPERAGSQGGLLQVFQTMPGIFAPIITGFIVDTTQSFTNAFYLTSIIAVSGIVVSLLFLKPPTTVESKKDETVEMNGVITSH